MNNNQKACKECGVAFAPRSKANTYCTKECAKLASTRTHSEWQRNNKDMVKVFVAKFRENNPERFKEIQRKSQKKMREKLAKDLQELAKYRKDFGRYE